MVTLHRRLFEYGGVDHRGDPSLGSISVVRLRRRSQS
jgi:hypothetical protein